MSKNIKKLQAVAEQTSQEIQADLIKATEEGRSAEEDMEDYWNRSEAWVQDARNPYAQIKIT